MFSLGDFLIVTRAISSLTLHNCRHGEQFISHVTLVIAYVIDMGVVTQ
jgi:hypothetical protein